jgi:hypothetical protein
VQVDEDASQRGHQARSRDLQGRTGLARAGVLGLGAQVLLVPGLVVPVVVLAVDQDGFAVVCGVSIVAVVCHGWPLWEVSGSADSSGPGPELIVVAPGRHGPPKPLEGR